MCDIVASLKMHCMHAHCKSLPKWVPQARCNVLLHIAPLQVAAAHRKSCFNISKSLHDTFQNMKQSRLLFRPEFLKNSLKEFRCHLFFRQAFLQNVDKILSADKYKLFLFRNQNSHKINGFETSQLYPSGLPCACWSKSRCDYWFYKLTFHIKNTFHK